MYFNDHLPPHFHVRYAEHRAVFAIADLRMTEGSLPPRVTALVLEWANLHREELLDNWQSIQEKGTFQRLEPLV